MPKPRRFVWWLALPLALAVLACNLSGPRPTAAPTLTSPALSSTPPFPSPTRRAPGSPTAAATTVAAVTDTEAPTQAPTSAPTEPAPTEPAATLSANGPWLVFSAAEGIWAANADGSGLTYLMPAAPYFRLGPAAPAGGHVVVVTGSDDSGLHGLALSLLSLPDGKLTKIGALTNAQTEPGDDAQFGDPSSFNVDVIAPLGQVAWSPDGAALAFIGAQAGPSADLFKYDLAAGQVTRLTDGASQAYKPSWSPDGRYIVQFGARTFGTGAGITLDGIWAAAADNSGVKTLYPVPGDSGGENLVAWAAPETFVVWTFNICANKNLRTYDIAAAQTQLMFPGFFGRMAADPATGVTLLEVDEFTAECDKGTQQGLFLARPGAAAKLLDDRLGDATQLGWSAEAGLFYAFLGDGWITYTPDGQVGPQLTAVTGTPIFAAGGKDWAWVDANTNQIQVRLGGGDAKTVSQDPALFPTWSPDGQTLLFFSESHLRAGDPRTGPPAATGPLVNIGAQEVVEWAK
jgi:hypothetical protein